ncbi:alpha/beta hydrolase fold domain-containing protein [Sphingomonas abietis]|uniref:Alpha/beta hydrolase fold domain-containing protein n=1 Tax=Sphingomonas abietis TaxID=3012344 RepID=A0ABY7NVK8_9SPHN|nr:alpha/beta hydrolase fold domain-containing protein [Sphingomonas abietis]WBO24688.1 alpha/beta hydrolase fold domain-containing protein [Sphingomonas abietis]
MARARAVPSESARMTAEQSLAGADPRDPRASMICGDPKALPALLIAAGERDVLDGDAIRMAERQTQANIRSEFRSPPDSRRSFPALASATPETVAAIARMADCMNAKVDQ